MLNQRKQKIKIHVKKGDLVKVISGEHSGKVGKVKKILARTNRIIVENTQLRTKHLRPKQKNESGQIIQIESPIHSSNVMLYSKKFQTASRYKKVVNNKIKQRILKKTGEIIDN